MLVTLSGISMPPSDEHPENAYLMILVVFSGITMSVSIEQFWKAPSNMFPPVTVTERKDSGI